MLLVYVCVTLFQGVLSWIGPNSNETGGEGAKLTRPINVIIFTATLVFYSVSVKILRRLDKQQNFVMEEATRRLSNMAAIYVTLYILFFLPMLIYQIIVSLIIEHLSKSQLGVLSFTVLNLPSIHGDCNGMFFLIKNIPSKRLIIEESKKWRKFFTSFKSSQGVISCPERKDVIACRETKVVLSHPETKFEPPFPEIKDGASYPAVSIRKINVSSVG